MTLISSYLILDINEHEEPFSIGNYPLLTNVAELIISQNQSEEEISNGSSVLFLTNQPFNPHTTLNKVHSSHFHSNNPL